MKVVDHFDPDGKSPFAAWRLRLERHAAAKVTTALVRLEADNLSNTKPVGGGVLEFRIDYGPGYRIYFGLDGDKLVILLAGGTKQRQSNDIKNAQQRWLDYKRQKRRG